MERTVRRGEGVSRGNWSRAVAIAGMMVLVAGCGLGDQGDACQFTSHGEAVTKGGNRAEPTDPVIKGYVGRNNEKFYLVPGNRLYKRTNIDEAKGMRWFCTEKEAESAGWTKAV